MRRHAELIIQEKYTTMKTIEQIMVARANCPSEFDNRFHKVVLELEQLVCFFEKLSEIFLKSSDEAEEIILKIARILDDQVFDRKSAFRTDLLD